MKKRILSVLLAFALLLSCIPMASAAQSGFAGQSPMPQPSTNPVGLATDVSWDDGPGLEENPAAEDATKIVNDASGRFSQQVETYAADDKVTFMVELDQKPQLSLFSAQEITQGTAGVQSYAARQAYTLNALKKDLNKVFATNEDFEIGFTYTIATTGLSVTAHYGDLETIKAMPGVANVYVAPVFALPEEASTRVDSEQTLQPMTSNSSTMIGADQLNASGYTGKGQKIAILDTGIVVDHPNFAALPAEKLTETSLTEEFVDSIWDTLNASDCKMRNYAYYSSKLPFTFNYYSMNFDVSHNTAGSDHGTHVAGIAAANKVEGSNVTGVAPDAQILVMQVFGSNGAGWDTIVAALEDCVRLGVDSINLSLGAAGGFTEGSESMSAVMTAFEDSGIELLIAAGNETHSGYGNLTGLNMSLSGNPDIGLTGTPSTFPQAISVASVDNDGADQLYFTVGDQQIGFSDTAATEATSFLTNFLGQSLEFVMVPGYGAAADYEGLDVAGKVAVVSRGNNSFPEKQTAAQEAGAIACVVYNNVPGTILMQINDGEGNIPCVSVSQASGAAMANAFAAGTKTLTVCNGDMIHVNLARTMSDFSTWGVTPDLKLKPEISGVGGAIISTRDPALSGSNYGEMSGTSMATPQVAGAMAVLLQYLKENTDLEGAELRRVAANLMLSTADPVMYGELEYSPRNQGAGLVNLVDATSSLAFLANPDSFEDRAKAELGDDDAKTGVYAFDFEIHNFSTDKALSYSFDSSLFTETLYGGAYIANMPRALDGTLTVYTAIATDVLCYDFNDDGVITTADARVLLRHIHELDVIGEDNAHFTYLDVDGNGQVEKADVDVITAYCAELPVEVDLTKVVTITGSEPVEEITVPAGETVTLTAQIVLADSDKKYLDESFENGMYVEGFLYVNSTDEGGVDLQMPIVGFYGDWSDAPIFDASTSDEASLYPRTAYTNAALLGSNPYIRGGKSGDQYNAFSYANPLAELDIGLLRGAKKIEFVVTNKDTGEEYWSVEGSEIAKSYYNASYGMVIPFYVLASEGEVWDGKDANGNNLPDGTRIVYTTNAWVDDGDEIVDDTWSFEATMDNQFPVIDNAETLQQSLNIDVSAGKIGLTLSITENEYVAALMFIDSTGTIMGKYEVDNVPGETFTQTYDITGYGSDFTIVVADYACNETEVDVVLDLGELAGMKPQLKKLSTDRIYGCEISNIESLGRGWFSANKEDLSDLRNETFDTETVYYAAEYVNGYVVAMDMGGNIVLLTPYNSYWGSQMLVESNSEIGDPYSQVFYDMALDHSGSETETWMGRTDSMYAVGWTYTDSDGYNALYKLCINSNGYTWISEVATISGILDGAEALTLGCTTDGQLYTIDTNGLLYTMNKTTGECTYVATTSFTQEPEYIGVNVIQSMAYDHNTGKMYWAAHSQNNLGTYTTVLSATYTVDLTTGECTEVGSYGQSGSTAMFIPNDLESDYIVMGGDPTSVSISPYSMTMVEGQRKLMSVTWSPWFAMEQPITWTSSDESVATVNSAGLVTAVKEGNATITATTSVWNEYGGEPDENWNYPGAWENRTATCEVEVVKSESELYGFVIADYKNADNGQSWVTFADQSPKQVTQIGKQYVPTTDQDGNPAEALAVWQGGAYYEGNIYTVQMEQWIEGDYIMTGTALYRTEFIRGETPAESRLGEMVRVGATAGIEVGNISFDYNTGRMYGTDCTNGGLVIIDLDTGAVDALGTFSGDIGGPAVMPAMCVTADGLIVGSDMDGNLYTVDADTLYTTRIGSAGAEYWYYGAMTYDYNTGSIYWAPCHNADQSPLYMVRLGQDEWDPERITATIIDLGDVSSSAGAEITVLFAVPENEPETNHIHVESISISNGDAVTGLVGGSLQLTAVTEPLRPTVTTKTWTSSNTDVVTVDHFGNLSYVGVGEADVTVSISNKGDRTDTFTDTIHVTVLPAGGELAAYLADDSYSGSGYYDFWLTIYDYAASAGQRGDSTINTYSMIASEYYDGYWYGYDKLGNFYRISNADRLNYVKLGTCNLPYEGDLNNNYAGADQVTDMAIDYTTSTMYGLTYTGKLVTVDLNTGYVTEVATLDQKVYALAADMNGNLYAAGSADRYSDAVLYTLDKTTGSATAVTTLTGIVVFTGEAYYGTPMYNSQMTYDVTTNRLYLNATACERRSSTNINYGLIMIQLGGEGEPAYYNLGKPAIKFERGSNKIGNMFLGGLAAIPTADETPVGPVNGIILNKASARVASGETLTLSGSIRPSNAVNQDILWSSSDETIATVDANGVVTGVSDGTVTIIATSAADANITATCTVTVVTPSANPSKAYTVSADLNALITFNPELPGSTVEVVAEFHGAGNVRGINVVGNTMYYAEINTGYYPMLWAYNLITHEATAMGYLYVYNDQISDMTYDPVNNYFYVANGFYIFKFDPTYMEPTAVNWSVASIDTTWYDYSYTTLGGIVFIDGMIYYTGNGYQGNTMMRINEDLNSNSLEQDLFVIDVQTDSKNVEMAYDSSAELFYITDADNQLHAFDLEGNFTPVDAVGNHVDVNGLAIVPSATNP